MGNISYLTKKAEIRLHALAEPIAQFLWSSDYVTSRVVEALGNYLSERYDKLQCAVCCTPVDSYLFNSFRSFAKEHGLPSSGYREVIINASLDATYIMDYRYHRPVKPSSKKS